MAKILDQVQDLENEGYEFEAAEASFDLLVKKAAGLYQPRFERLSYRVNVEADARRRSRSPRRRSRSGSATRSSTPSARATARSTPSTAPCARRCSRTYPRLAEMQLVDYKVRVVNARDGHGRPRPRRHRVARRRRRLGHRRRQREHHRGELAGAGRQLRVQAVQGRGKGCGPPLILRPRRGIAAPSRARRASHVASRRLGPLREPGGLRRQ